MLRSLRSELAADAGQGLGSQLTELLSAAEVARTAQRVTALLRSRSFPQPPARGPSIPWPPW